MSGWKIYVYGETLRHASNASLRLLPLCIKYNLTCKIATAEIIERNLRLQPAWGVAVIYCTPDVIISLSLFLQDIKDVMKGYTPHGHYKGSAIITSCLSYRYDMWVPLHPGMAVGYEYYFSHYRGEFGSYNIPLNIDPFL
jgi:hypothetical protein